MRNNDYEKLVEYLEGQKVVNLAPQQEIKKETHDVVHEVIENSKVYSYIPPREIRKKSKNFDILKLESMMRSKLIEEYKKQQSYTRPYISVGELLSCVRQVYYNRSKYPMSFMTLSRNFIILVK